jgi:hypothetical protein
MSPQPRCKLVVAIAVCATSNFPYIHRALTKGVICRRAWNEEDICCLHRGRNDRWFARRDAGKREEWRCCRRLWSRALRFWQLRMGDEAFLGRPWLAGSPSASLLLICDLSNEAKFE